MTAHPSKTETGDVLLRGDIDRIALLSLNKPGSRNTLSEAMLAALCGGLPSGQSTTPKFLEVSARWQRPRPRRPGAPARPTTAPTSMYEEGAGENSPFFPSSANTTSGKTIPSNFFMTSETCQRCHAESKVRDDCFLCHRYHESPGLRRSVLTAK